MIFLVRIFAIILAWTLVQNYSQRDKLFFVQETSGNVNETVLVVTWMKGEDEISSGCEIFRDKDLITEVLESSNGSPIRTLSEDELQTLPKDCTEFVLRRKRRETDKDDEESETNLLNHATNGPAELTRDRNNRQQNRRGSRRRNDRRPRGRTSTTTLSNVIESTTDSSTIETTTDSTTSRTRTVSSKTETTTDPPTTLGYDGLPVIYPGTKWCGAGAIAKSYDELGTYQDTDRCCRDHDHCNDTLAPGETRYNLTNKSPFTKLSCECDQKFFDCLARVNSFTSNSIGNMYFNILKRECYKKEYPLTKKCKRYLTLLKITCMEYERDRTAPKVYQFIPAKTYKYLGVPG